MMTCIQMAQYFQARPLIAASKQAWRLWRTRAAWDPDLGIYGGLLGSSLDGPYSEMAQSSN